MRRCHGFNVHGDLRSKRLLQKPSPAFPNLESLANTIPIFGDSFMVFGKTQKTIGADHPDFETAFDNGVIPIKKNCLCRAWNISYKKRVQNTMSEQNWHEKSTVFNDTNSSRNFLKLLLELRRAPNITFNDQNNNLSKSQQIFFNLNGTTIKSLVNAVRGLFFNCFFGSGTA